MNELPAHLVQQAEVNVNNILTLAIKHDRRQSALVVSDQDSPLAIALTRAYEKILPDALFLDFASHTAEDILAEFDKLVPHDLIVLIQSTKFKLGAFRLRIELFQKQFKVIEHPHLACMDGIEAEYYIDSLQYDPGYYHQVGHQLKKLLDAAKIGRVDSGNGAELTFDGPFEDAKLNIGDYTSMFNIGGQFPIGEVFTEAQDLESVNGKVRIFVFGDTAFQVNKPDQPITLIIEKGRVVAVEDSTPEFDLVLNNIRADEGEVWLRELGFGMNRAFSDKKMVSDIGTFERVCGIHLSLGAKHGAYKKPQFKRANIRHHVDVFAITEGVYLDEVRIFVDGAWQV